MKCLQQVTAPKYMLVCLLRISMQFTFSFLSLQSWVGPSKDVGVLVKQIQHSFFTKNNYRIYFVPGVTKSFFSEYGCFSLKNKTENKNALIQWTAKKLSKIIKIILTLVSLVHWQSFLDICVVETFYLKNGSGSWIKV